MSWTEGVSQCWPLAKDCHLWWDAWSALGSFLAVGATIVLGVFTYRLGKAANAATGVALGISKSEADRQRKRDVTERILVLVQIAGEISTAHEVVTAEIERLANPESYALFLAGPTYRHEVFTRIDSCKFPVTTSLTDRLHYLEHEVSARLVRATNMLASLQAQARSWGTPESSVTVVNGHRTMVACLFVVADDLKVVMEASREAVIAAGIYTPAIEAQLEQFKARINGG